MQQLQWVLFMVPVSITMTSFLDATLFLTRVWRSFLEKCVQDELHHLTNTNIEQQTSLKHNPISHTKMACNANHITWLFKDELI